MKPCKQVLMIVSNAFEPDVRVYKEAITLSNEGFYVKIIAWDRQKKYPENENMGKITIRRCHISGQYGKKLFSIFHFIFFYCSVFSIAQESRFTVVHAHDLDTLPIGYIISKIKKCRLIYDAHETTYFSNFPFLFQDLFSKLERFLSKRARFICITNEIQRKKFESHLFDKSKIIMIRNCPFKEFFSEPIYKKEQENLFFVWIGYIQRGVGIEILCHLANCYMEKYPSLHLLLVGKVHPNYKQEFRDLLGELRFHERVKWIDGVVYDEVKKYYQILNISIMLYSNIGQYNLNTPTKLYESMACGIPVIASPISDVDEIITAANCGYVFETDAIEKIEETLELLIKNNKLRYRLGVNGFHHATRFFSWEQAGETLINCYNQICRENSYVFN